MKIECVVDAHAQVGEGPVWDGADGVLWWTDINGRLMHRFDPKGGNDTAYELPFRVGCFALREKGGFVLAAEHGFWFWKPGSEPEHVLDVEADRADNRMNDGGCDRQGRLFGSSMNLAADKKPTGAVWRLNADLSVEKVADGLHIGNGIAFSPAGDRFYLADTTVDTVWAHDYDTAGRVGERQVFASTETLAGKPDGATVDAEGGYWLAGVMGGQLYRFLPSGELDVTIDMPTTKPTRPMFGGAGLDELYVTSIGSNAAANDPQAGGLFRITGLGFTGLPEPRFAG